MCTSFIVISWHHEGGNVNTGSKVNVLTCPKGIITDNLIILRMQQSKSGADFVEIKKYSAGASLRELKLTDVYPITIGVRV